MKGDNKILSELTRKLVISQIIDKLDNYQVCMKIKYKDNKKESLTVREIKDINRVKKILNPNKEVHIEKIGDNLIVLSTENYKHISIKFNKKGWEINE